MDKELRYIHPSLLHDWWDQVLPGLLKVREHSSDGWRPEDVYSEIRAGRSTLHIGLIDAQYIGFVVLTPLQSYDGNRLNVWCAYAKTEHDPVALFIDDLKEMARAINAKKLTFSSPRRWDKRLRNYGWNPVKTTYAMEV